MINYEEKKGQYSVSRMMKVYDDQEVKKSEEGRWRSWEHCHSAFVQSINDPNEDLILSFHLFGFLASWGMYRGSSFLLKDYSYMVHRDVIPLLRYKASNLLNLSREEIFRNRDRFSNDLCEVYDRLGEYYMPLNSNQVETSCVLITKILMATYGCIPAYDRYFKTGLSEYGIQKSGKPKNLFGKLLDWLRDNPSFCSEIEKELERINQNDRGATYTFMKLVDMYFYFIGKEIEDRRKNENSEEINK